MQGEYLIAGLCAPYPGETVCGDGWAVGPSAARIAVLMADGSGHGPEAHKAALRSIEIFRERRPIAASKHVAHAIDRALAVTRGAAVAVAEIDPGVGASQLCGDRQCLGGPRSTRAPCGG